jgi:small subunit ribosomal protein S17
MPRRIMSGKVVSDKANKTVTVLVERRVKDPLYGKVVKKSRKFAAHDEANLFREGDVVQIEECRPISKNKTWKVITEAPKGRTPREFKQGVFVPGAPKKAAVRKKTATKKA